MSNWLGELWRRLRFFINRRQFESDLDEEMRLHKALRQEEYRDIGIDQESCRHKAQRQFGNDVFLKEISREMWGWASLERCWQYLRYGFRILRKSPVFTAAAVITLSLGIGANTAIYSVIDAVLLRPLPYVQPERLVRLWQNEPKMGQGRLGTAPPEFVSYRDQVRVFSNLAGYSWESYDLTGDREPEHIRACRATASLFPTLGVQRLIARTFVAREEIPGAAKVAVLSYKYWNDHYANNPSILGTIIRLNEQPYHTRSLA
ncbi:MAG: hypothetical protein DMG57_38875 [Acidobacteria bacterium]|nr:MAG: hypothetical protein DMG57_38875 [Acidobacteriota bacterium]